MVSGCSGWMTACVRGFLRWPSAVALNSGVTRRSLGERRRWRARRSLCYVVLSFCVHILSARIRDVSRLFGLVGVRWMRLLSVG